MRSLFKFDARRKGWIGAVALGAATLAHFILPAVPDDTPSVLMILDRVFDLIWAGIFSLAAIGVGRWVLRKTGCVFQSVGATSVWAWGIGAGIFSQGLLFLGLAHLLSKPLVIALLFAAVGLTVREWRATGRELWAHWQTKSAPTSLERILIVALVLLVLPVLLGALLPPTEGDALSYQLAAPSLFLERQSVFPVFENTGANYPLGASMLFMFGLAVDSPIAAQLTHFLFGLALMGAIYAFTAENFGRPAGLLASVIYWTSPVVGLEANAPLLDLGWVFYEFLAIWMFWRWHQTRSMRALILMGVALGLAMASKYLAFVGLGVMGLLVGCDALFVQRKIGRSFRDGLILGGVALVVVSPWLLKNFVMLGNPVYPFFLGTYGLDGQLHNAAKGLDDWVGAGMGNDLTALLMFPYNVYVHWQRFDPVKNRGGPSFFFWLLPFYALVPKRALVSVILLIVAIRFGVWWNLTQFVRYGLIFFPLLSVVCGYTAWELLTRVRGRWGRPLLQIAITFFAVMGIALQWGFLFFLRDGSVAFLLGLESRAAFLDTNLHDYRAIQFMNSTFPADARIFALGDTRVFYLRRRMIGDVAHANWAELVTWGQTLAGVRERLNELGVNYIWVSEEEIIYARNFWNIPPPWQTPGVSFADFRACCLERLYEDERGHSIYVLRDGVSP